jgi:1A family penicillin-binding protein
MPVTWPRRTAIWRALLLTGGVLGVVAFAAGAVWIVQHAWAVHRLNRGVGDTVFLDAAGRPWFRLDEQRRDVPFDRIATTFKDGVIAVEDHRFYWHPGVDPIALGRAALYNLRSEQGMQGGSTITQQLARTLFLSNDRTWGRKAREAALALLLEAFLSKREILELYMNRVYLSGGIYGVETMSQKLLRKSARDLSLAEAALIAGIIRAPALYSPWTHPREARARSHVVLRRMREEGTITAAQEEEARAQRIAVQPQPAVTNARHGYAKEYLRQQFRARFGSDNPPDWRVHTTFVPELQDAAERAVRNGLRRRADGLQAALVAMDPETGNLLALVGGSDYRVTAFNRATRARRQPGSAFKPFVYAVALERGQSPVSRIDGLRQVAVQAPEGVWIPRNERGGQDQLTLREALVQSNNAAAVLLQQQVGSGPILRLASSLGVREQPDVPSLALGSGLVSPLELTAAYAVFPTLGARVRPRGLVSVLDAEGRNVHQVHVDTQRVLSEAAAFQMVTMLRGVVDEGTGAAARRLGVRGDVAGKTGTTNDYRDAWFVGFNAEVVVGVWVGFDEPASIGASGAEAALPIWAEFMRTTARRLPAARIEPPAGLRTETLCRLSHERAVRDCPGYIEYFKEGDEVPGALCPMHDGTLGEETRRAVRTVLGAVGRGLRGIFR